MIRRLLPTNLRATRASLAFLHDVAMAAVSVPLSLHLRLGGDLLRYSGDVLLPATLIFTAVAACVFWFLGLYRGIWRYASMNDVLAIARAVTLTVLIFLPIMFLVSRLDGVPRSTLVINWFVLMTLLGAPRFAYRVLKDGSLANLLERGDPLRATLLVGADDSAEQFVRAMGRSRHAPYRVIGIVEAKDGQSAGRVGRRIRDVPVLGSLDDLPEVIARLKRREMLPQRLIVTGDDLDRDQLARLLEIAEGRGMTLARLPRLDELRSATPAAEIKPLAPEDLLGRPRMVLDREAMRRLIAGRRVLITGAGGSIGGELAQHVADLAPAHVTLLDHAEFLLYRIDRAIASRAPQMSRRAVLADVRDAARLARIMAEDRPELVFHAAALKHVPMAEADPTETVLTNVIGTRNVADAARAAGARAMVLISTDKAVDPVSVLGASKRLAEAYCQALDLASPEAATRFVVVRFGNVLGSTGSVVPLFQAQLAAGGPLTVTHPEVTRYFMTVGEAVELVLEASALGSGTVPAEAADGAAWRGKVFVLDMGRPVKILDLARQMIRMSGKRPDKDVEIVFTGMRPGEKLHEELSSAGEGLAPTVMPGVLVAGPRSADWPILVSALDELEQTARSGRAEPTIALLSRLVPEYRSAAPGAAPAIEGERAAAFRP